MNKLTNIKPRWIKRIRPNPGQDHLGLGSVSSDQILSHLCPGINVLSPHPRYYSYYTFLLDEFWKRERPRNLNSWVKFYRSKEAIFAIGANLCNRPEHIKLGSIIGSRTAAPLAKNALESYSSTYNYIDTELGGYQLYYRTVIISLGLIYPGGPGFRYPLDLPSERGKEVAAAFRETIQNTIYYREYFDDDEAVIPAEVIAEFIGKACLCQLKVGDTQERSLLMDIFLHGGDEAAASARRETLCFFLDIADQTNGFEINEPTFRQLIYFEAAENGASYTPRKSITKISRKWRLYQAREYYAYALNGLWYYLCDWGISESGNLDPIEQSRIERQIDHNINLSKFANHFGLNEPNLAADNSYHDLLDWLLNIAHTDEQNFDRECRLTSPIQEQNLLMLFKNNDDPEILLSSMTVMLALIFLRFNQPSIWFREDWGIACMGANGRLSMNLFINALRQKLEGGNPTIGDIMRWLINDYVILQHLIIATNKLPENTFRFEQEGNALRFHIFENGFGLNDSRFDAISTTVHELGLCGDFRDPSHFLTRAGKKLLSAGDL